MRHEKYKDKTFLKGITDAEGKKFPSSFQSFPSGIRFNGQERKEEIVLVIRRHPIAFVSQILMGIGLILIGLLGFMFLTLLDFQQGSILILFIGGLIFLISFVLTLAFTMFVKWYYNVNIITNQRIIDVDFNSFVFHEIVEAQLEKVEDIYHEAAGFGSTLFDYGNVFVQTAGTRSEFDMYQVPRPRDIQDTISDLLELKQNE